MSCQLLYMAELRYGEELAGAASFFSWESCWNVSQLVSARSWVSARRLSIFFFNFIPTLIQLSSHAELLEGFCLL